LPPFTGWRLSHVHNWSCTPAPNAQSNATATNRFIAANNLFSERGMATTPAAQFVAALVSLQRQEAAAAHQESIKIRHSGPSSGCRQGSNQFR
jgi:hypothetical protein